MSKTYTIGRFPSRILKKRHVKDFVCSETVYQPDQLVATHAHESACIVMNLQGSFTEISGNREFRCSVTDVLFRPPGDPHSNSFNRQGAKCLTIEIPGGWLKNIQAELALDVESTLHVSDGGLSLMSGRLYREFTCLDTASILAIEGLILEIFAMLSRGRIQKADVARGSLRIVRARDIIHDRFSENLTVGDIAGSIDVHPAHLAREFRRHYRCTVGEYLRRTRIRHACVDLANDDVPLAVIALNCGFSDQSHFSRVFKQQIGITPSAYRANIGKR